MQQSLRGAGLITVAGVAASTGLGRAVGADKAANPFAYDVERFRNTDPKLLQYEQFARFGCPHPEPHRLAIGAQDRLFIAAGSFICVLERDGTAVSEIPLGGVARCIGLAKDGTMYVGLKEHLEVFDSQGHPVATWESAGKHAWFTGLAVSENEVFAADAGNRMIIRYAKSGKVAGRIGEKSHERNVPGLIVPSPYLDVALAPDGLLRVNNPGRHRVEVYTTSGDLETFWGKPSATIDGFCGCCNPIAVTLLPDGRCVTCEKGLPRVKIYSAEGKFESVVAGPESFPENSRTIAPKDQADGRLGGMAAAVDSQGHIYILDLVKGDVRVMKKRSTA